MKKLLFSLLAITMLAANVQAQSYFGVRGGFSSASFKGDVSQPGLSAKDVYGFTGGIFADLGVANFFAIQPEINYIRLGQRYDFDGDEAVTARLDYIQVPIFAKINLGPEIFKVHLMAGPYFGYGFGGTKVVKAFGASFDGKVDYNDEDFNRFDAGVGAAVGFSIKLGTGRLGADLRYQAGLTNVAAKNNDAYDGSIQNRSLSGTLFVAFPLSNGE